MMQFGDSIYKGNKNVRVLFFSCIKENRTERKKNLSWFFLLHIAWFCRFAACFLLLSTIEHFFLELQTERKGKIK